MKGILNFKIASFSSTGQLKVKILLNDTVDYLTWLVLLLVKRYLQENELRDLASGARKSKLIHC